MKTFYLFFPLFFAVLSTLSQAEGVADLQQFKVDKEFEPILKACPFLIEAGGAKIIKKEDGSLWLISVGSTTARPGGGGSEIMRRRMVALGKARAHAISELNGNQVTATSILTTTDTTTIENGKETGASEEVLTEKIILEAKGVLKNMPQIASWLNKEKTLYFLAVGKKLTP